METDIVVAVIAAGSAITGGVVSGIFNVVVEHFKNKSKRKEQKSDFNQQIEFERMKIYSKFVETDGNFKIRGDVENPVFNLDLYLKHVRPIFFEKLYLLHPEIKKHLFNIDHEIAFINYYRETSDYDKDILGDNYNNIYKIISNELEKYDVIRT